MASIKLERRYTTGKYGETLSYTAAIIDGQSRRPDVVACVWRDHAWRDGATLFSRMESVMRVGDALYRMGDRAAKPLRLEPGEHLFPTDHPIYNGRLSFTEQRPA